MGHLSGPISHMDTSPESCAAIAGDGVGAAAAPSVGVGGTSIGRGVLVNNQTKNGGSNPCFIASAQGAWNDFIVGAEREGEREGEGERERERRREAEACCLSDC